MSREFFQEIQQAPPKEDPSISVFLIDFGILPLKN